MIIGIIHFINKSIWRRGASFSIYLTGSIRLLSKKAIVSDGKVFCIILQSMPDGFYRRWSSSEVHQGFAVAESESIGLGIWCQAIYQPDIAPIKTHAHHIITPFFGTTNPVLNLFNVYRLLGICNCRKGYLWSATTETYQKDRPTYLFIIAGYSYSYSAQQDRQFATKDYKLQTNKGVLVHFAV